MYLEPEQQARIKIDDLLQAAGWILQHKHAFNRQAGLGVVVREFQLASGPCDYALLIYYRNFIIGQPQYRHSPHLQNACRRQPDVGNLPTPARTLGYESPPFRWDEEDRRHRLDALYFMLYGLTDDEVTPKFLSKASN